MLTTPPSEQTQVDGILWDVLNALNTDIDNPKLPSLSCGDAPGTCESHKVPGVTVADWMGMGYSQQMKVLKVELKDSSLIETPDQLYNNLHTDFGEMSQPIDTVVSGMAQSCALSGPTYQDC
jgi:hypothetical protein